MKFKIFKYLPALMFASVFSGCSNEDVVDPSVTRTSETVIFTIFMSSETDGTRTGLAREGEVTPSAPDNAGDSQNWGQFNPSETGTDFDNKIVSLQPVLYETKTLSNGKVVVDPQKQVGTMKVYSDGVQTVSSDASGTTYTVKALLECNKTLDWLSKAALRFVVYANVSPTGYDKATPYNSWFERHGLPESVENGIKFEAIPMFGIGNASFEGIKDVAPGKFFSIKDGDDKTHDAENKDPLNISMLRSMAKIRVNVKEEDDYGQPTSIASRDVKLVSLNIDRHNYKGYVAPKGWEGVTSVKQLGLAAVMNPYLTGNNIYRPECNDVVKKNDTKYLTDKMLRFYIPETYNSDHDNDGTSTPIRIEVKYTCDCGECTGESGEPHTNYIYIGKYNADGTPDLNNQWDIIRNHIYEYNITGIADNFSLKCEVNIKPWGYVKINGIELGDDGKSQSSN